MNAADETPAVVVTRREDGTILLDHPTPLPAALETLPARLRHWSRQTPDAPFMTEDGCTLTYGDAEARRASLSAKFASLEIGTDAPLMIVGGNGIDHAIAMMAATAIGIPVAIVSPAYATPAAAPWGKLEHVIASIAPGLILADDPAGLGAVLQSFGANIRVEALRDAGWLRHVVNADVDVAQAAVGLDTVAKLLLTSGSTGSPKGVINTQRMMVSNMLALDIIWPFLSKRAPVLVDWLPWNHTFGGNCCFDIALWFGGHMVIDKSRPAPGQVEQTIALIREYRPSIYFNVPAGYELLLSRLENDEGFAQIFFGPLDFVFNAGAALPTSTRAKLEAVGLKVTGRLPNIVGGWGSTETAPFSTALTFPTKESANLGLPIPGTTIKMVPSGERLELRVRGPNVTPGYWRNPDLTAQAFDEEGFYCIGDAGRFAEPGNAAAGIIFDGRLAENFKLSTGTFVNVGALRLAAISASERLVSDAVVVGEGRNELGLILFANDAACRALIDELGEEPWEHSPAIHPAVVARLCALFRSHNNRAGGSSMRIARFVIAGRQPDPHRDEITDKGYINQRRVIENNVEMVEALFRDGHKV